MLSLLGDREVRRVIFRVNIKYSLISEPPNLPAAKAMDVSRIVWSGGVVLTQRRREAESAE